MKDTKNLLEFWEAQMKHSHVLATFFRKISVTLSYDVISHVCT